MREETEEVRTVRGTVRAVAQNDPRRYGIKLAENGAWYDGFGKCPVKRGAFVEIAYVRSGKWRNVKAINEVSRDPLRLNEPVPDGFSPSHRNGLASIVYSVALKASAVLFCNKAGATASDVMAAAEDFAKWLLRKSGVQRPSVRVVGA